MIAVTLVGGYLGAGKTTTLNHLLASIDEPIAVLVNDFGSLNIDESLIESRDGEVVSLANGCICCSMTDGFVAALDQIRSLDPLPGRLVIETSGVGDLQQIANYAGLPGLQLDGIVCVADAENVRAHARDRFVGDLVRTQLAVADLVVLNKVDLVDDARREAARRVLASLAPDATIVEAVRGEVPAAVLLGANAGGSIAPLTGHDHDHVLGDGHEHRDAGSTFVSWTWERDSPLPRAELEAALASLPDAVVRAKGLVRTEEDADRAVVVQVVGRRRDLRPGGPWRGGRSAVVFIAVDEELAPADVPALFAPT